MKSLSLIICFLLLTLCLGSDCLAKEWRRIIPLRSMRADIERALNVQSTSKLFDSFSLDEEVVMIFTQNALAAAVNLINGMYQLGRLLK